jgi:2,3-bisphosphoglycerate-independent phosphoglycerate mutase
MKNFIIIPDGLCDFRYPSLNNQSPVEFAHTPGLDNLVQSGQIGMANTMVAGLPLGSLVGMMGILGYQPADYFPLARSIFEAHSLGLTLGTNDVAFRCNIVCVEQDTLTDFTAGQIDDQTAEAYLETINLPAPFEITHDLSYRNVLIWRNCPLDLNALTLYEPHEHVGIKLNQLLPQYQNQNLKPLINLMTNSARDGLMLFPWAASRPKSFPPLSFRLHLVTGLGFLAGMVQKFGGIAHMPAGATGYIDSDYEAKLKTLLAHMDEFDVGVIHCNAPDEEAHIGNIAGKIQAIEKIDRQVVIPLIKHLEKLNQPYRILYIPDHYTICQDGRHKPDPVPFVLGGTDVFSNHSLSNYSELEIKNNAGFIMNSSDLIKNLLISEITTTQKSDLRLPSFQLA